MSKFLAGGGLGAAASVANSAIGMIGQRAREKRANKQTEKLMGMQHKNQKDLNEHSREQSYGLSMDIFNSQSQEAKRKQLEDAGLSVGMMYGGSGAGGSTTAGVGGGSAAMGSAAAPQQMPQMLDIGAIAQTALLDAQRRKLEAETREIDERGKGNWLDNLITKYSMSGDPEEVSVEKHSKYGVGGVSPTSTVGRSTKAEADRAEQELKNMKASEQKDIVLKVESEINQQLKKSQMELNDEQIRKIENEIIIMYVNAGLKGLDTIVKGRLGSIGKGK